MRLEREYNIIWLHTKRLGKVKFAWMPFGIWAVCYEENDYGSAVLAFWRFWIAWYRPARCAP